MTSFRNQAFLFTLCMTAASVVVPPTADAMDLTTLGTNTLVEWTQNLTQACGHSSCRDNVDAKKVNEALHQELRSRLTHEIQQDPENISAGQWTLQLQNRSEAERCRLLRSVYALSLTQAQDSANPLWRLFTQKPVLTALEKLGHRPHSGASPSCPDFFFPQSDVVEQAILRGERLYQGPSLTPDEAANRIEKLRGRYLSRGSASRTPQG